MRRNDFVSGNFYHIYLHAVENLTLFRDEADYNRFIKVLFLGNSELPVPRLERTHGLNPIWDLRDLKFGKLDLGNPLVKIACFCLMPNHIHLLLGEREDGNISKFMHKILISFSKYSNLKYERRGHLFESRFHSKLLKDNNYLLRASCYIHLNPKDIAPWQGKENRYYWSSFQDYVKQNRWGKLLDTDIILSQFENNGNVYLNFVEETRHDPDYEL